MILRQITDSLKGKAPLTAKRSPLWPKTRSEHIKKFPTCAVCGETKKLEVHHIIPFHVAPELELDPNNLITLCESKSFGVTCHLFFGHLGNYSRINLNVKEDSLKWKELLLNEKKKDK